MPKAILFDLGNTVMEERSYNLVAGFNAISNSFSTDISFDELKRSISLGQQDNCEFNLVDWIEHQLVKSDRSEAEKLELVFWNNVVSLLPISGVQLVLGFLNKNNIKLAAISNAIFSSNCLIEELKRHNLNQYFEFVISSADHRIRKPHPLLFKEALASLDVQRNDVWFIGDRWDADIIGASSVGIVPVWFGGDLQDYDINIKHLKLSRWSEFMELWSQHAEIA